VDIVPTQGEILGKASTSPLSRLGSAADFL
jgi:hypothetical protein